MNSENLWEVQTIGVLNGSCVVHDTYFLEFQNSLWVDFWVSHNEQCTNYHYYLSMNFEYQRV